MADLAVNAFVSGSVEETLVAASVAGDAIPAYTGKEFLIVKNSHATVARTVTLGSLENCNQGFDHDLAVSVPALKTHIIKAPNPTARWKDVNGKLQITYSTEVDLTIGAFKWPE